MSTANRFLSSFVVLLLSSHSIHAASDHCIGGKCRAAFVNQEATQQELNQASLMTQNETHGQFTSTKNNIKTFKNMHFMEDVLEMDIPQNEIIIDKEPILLVAEQKEEAQSFEEISIDDSIIVEENHGINTYTEELLLSPKELTVAPQYECTGEKEILICNAEDLNDCECV